MIIVALASVFLLAVGHILIYGRSSWRDALALTFLWCLVLVLLYFKMKGGFPVSPLRYFLNFLTAGQWLPARVCGL